MLNQNIKKILLLYPRTGFDPIKPRMPSSLIYLGTYLKEQGYQPIIIDTRVDSNFEKKIKENISESIAVGITTMTGMQILFALHLAKLIRNISKNIPIIWGGVHPTLLPEQTIKNEFVDIIVRGEGEETFLELIQNLEQKKEINDIKGITFKNKKGDIINNKDRPFLDINKLPMPDWDLIDYNKYRIFDVMSARGCPHRCTFCYNKKFNNRMWRSKNADLVLNEIVYLVKKYNIKQLNFIDDNFFTNKKRVEDICKGLIERKIDIKWRASCRIDYLNNYDETFLNFLNKAGLAELFIGAESGSQPILDNIKKDATIEQALNAVKKCRDNNIQGQYSKKNKQFVLWLA